MKVYIDKLENGKVLYLESDGTQYLLNAYNGKTVENKKTGKVTESFQTLGYFTNLRPAITKIIKLKIHESTATSLEELLKEIRKIEKKLDELIIV